MTIAEKLLKIDEGVEETIALNAELEQTLYGTDTGGKSYYDEFWDGFQYNGFPKNYDMSFYGSSWTDVTYKPKYELIVNSAYQTFSYARISTIPSIIFAESATLMDGTFLRAYYTHTICKLAVHENLRFSHVFDYDTNLKNLTIEGTIGQNGLNFQWSTQLSKDSIVSVITSLSTTTSGLSVTLSKTAVNNAFETSTGTADGSTSAEWLALIGTRSNWTISLV